MIALPYPDPGSETLGRASAQALRDFNLSFRFSQGDQSSQPPMFDLIAADYAAHWSDEATAELAASLSALGEAALRLRPPQRHIPIGETPARIDSNAERQLRRHWRQFEPRLESLQPIEPGSRAYARRMAPIVGNMMLADIRFMRKGRPNSGQRDPYSSQFRESVLLGEDSGSETFNHLLGVMRSYTLFRPDFRTLALLRMTWEARHPGDERCFPEDYRLQLEALATSTRSMRVMSWLGERLARLSYNTNQAVGKWASQIPNKL